MARRTTSLLVLLFASSALMASADGGPILHEYVPELAADEGSIPVLAAGALPDSIVHRGQVLPAPRAGSLRRNERPMRARAGDGRRREEVGRRSTGFRPDRVTNLEGSVPYYSVFTPSISPFKRITALNAVTEAADGTPVLGLAPGSRSVVELEIGEDDDARRPRDLFWGTVVLDFSDGAVVPFPAVSPESRLRSLTIEPPAELRIERDDADNLYAVLGSGERRRALRAVFLMDAPRDYFGGPMASDEGASLSSVSPMPARVRGDAQRFASELGLSEGSTFDAIIETLVRHFRGFEASREPPRDTGNIYLDLARGRRGICRHRAYAFTVTALALGVPARFVQNEAHAWVEVERPGGGWRRIDLGGAAVGLDERGRPSGQVSYDPGLADSLPQPDEYVETLSRARALAAAGRSTGAGASSAAPGGSSEALDGSASPAEQARRVAAARRATPALPRGRARPTLTLDRETYEVLRGHELEVTGSARGEGEAVPGLRIEVLLRSRRSAAERLIGVTVTRERGRFRGVFGVPPDLPVGEYRLVVRTPGNARWGAAQAR